MVYVIHGVKKKNQKLLVINNNRLKKLLAVCSEKRSVEISFDVDSLKKNVSTVTIGNARVGNVEIVWSELGG